MHRRYGRLPEERLQYWVRLPRQPGAAAVSDADLILFTALLKFAQMVRKA